MMLTMLKGAMIFIALGVAAIPATGFTQDADFVVTTLGTGTPEPSYERFGAATLVEAGGKRLLFDAGRGVLIRLNQAKVPAGSLDGVFITHLHSDHVNGLPDLFLSGWLPAPFGARTTPLQVYGPTGTRELTDGLTAAYSWDIEHRIEDQRLDSKGVALKTTEITGGVVYDNDGVMVTAFVVNHGEKLKTSLGYRVDYDGRSVTISGDTTYDENLIDAAQGTNLLIHQVAAARPELLAAGSAWGLIMAHHTTPEEVAGVFTEVNPDMAVLYHVVRLTNGKIPFVPYEKIVDRVLSGYSGEVVLAEDLMKFVIGSDAVAVQN